MIRRTRWASSAHLLIILALALLWGAACTVDDDDDDSQGGATVDDDDTTPQEDDTGADDDDVDAYPFEEYGWLQSPPDVLTQRLCPDSADPANAADKIFIECAMEGMRFAPTEVEPKDSVVVMAYNFERGVHTAEQIEWLLNGPDSPHPDIILANEVDRGCSRSGNKHVMRELAEALGMYYVYAVEFVELPRPGGSGGVIDAACEHGNGILSRYPLGNARQIRHEANRSWYIPPEQWGQPGEPRLGGRIAVVADAKVGNRILHLFSLHFESEPGDAQYRDAQAAELAEDGLTQPFQVVIGGDTNAPFYFLDVLNHTANDATSQVFLSRGYLDTHRDVAYENRPTRGGFIIDLMFTLDNNFSDSQRCAPETCGGFSDHLPVWTTLDLTR